MRKIKNPEKNEYTNVSLRQMENTRFHNDLLWSQIDSIFNGMNAILETERVKIQALLSSGNVSISDTHVAPANAFKTVEGGVAQAQKEETQTVEQHFTMHAQAYEPQEDVTHLSELSQSEIDLAMRMRSSRDAGQVRKLEAVA